MKELTKSEKINLGMTEIAKGIRKQLKEEFQKCKFSVTIERFAGGNDISINLLKADRKTIKGIKDISDRAIAQLGTRFRREDIGQRQNESYHQLNPYTLRDEYHPEAWCNGVFLTEQGHTLLQRVVNIGDFYNYDDGDPQADYYSVNFYLHVELGKWNKDFVDGE